MTLCYIAKLNQGTNPIFTYDLWDVCRLSAQFDLETLTPRHWYMPISKGHTLDSALLMITQLNDGVAAAALAKAFAAKFKNMALRPVLRGPWMNEVEDDDGND